MFLGLGPSRVVTWLSSELRKSDGIHWDSSSILDDKSVSCALSLVVVARRRIGDVEIETVRMVLETELSETCTLEEYLLGKFESKQMR